MDNNLKGAVLFLTILTTGLSAGLFYAWAVSVIPGIKRIPDKSYLEAMQAINRAILNPGFFIIFFGALLLMIWSVYLQYKVSSGLSFWMIALATVTYLTGNMGVTIFGNIPLNEMLDQIQLTTLSLEELKSTRHAYERQWNAFHRIRTIFSVVSFLLLLLAVRMGHHSGMM